MFIPFVTTRYLFSHKRHNTINLIIAVSIVGVAVGTLALIAVLSVLNGFERVVENSFTAFDPELKIVPATGNSFRVDDPLLQKAMNSAEVVTWCNVVEQDALLGVNGKQSPAKVMGVDDNFASVAKIDSLLWDGEFALNHGDNDEIYGVIGILLAHKLETAVDLSMPIDLFSPKNKKINTARPEANFSKTPFYCSGIFSSLQNKYDEAYFILPINDVRGAYMLPDNYANYVDVRVSKLNASTDKRVVNKTKNKIKEVLGDNYLVLDRYEQQADFYKISKIEKFSTFLILSFILLIASFNIIGSLSMIVIEKREDISLFKALGATPSRIKKLFFVQGCGISLLGTFCGTFFGVIIVLLQDKFGWLKMGDGYLSTVYPVDLYWSDVVMVVLVVIAMGALASWYTAYHVNDINDNAKI